MLCAVCPREARGFGWYDPKLRTKTGKTFQTCSMTCNDIIAQRNGTMDDPTAKEINSMYAGGESGGQYLESIGKYDLSELGPDEYMTFIDAIITAYCDSMKALNGFSLREKEAVPF